MVDWWRDSCVDLWLGRLGVSAADTLETFKRFHEVLVKDEVVGGFSPSQLVEWQSNAVGRERYRVLRLAQDWVNGLPLRHSSKKTLLTRVRSFFLHNHAALPEDPGFSFKSDTPPVEGILEFESFRRIVHNSNKLYRAVFLLMAQGLMGEGEVVYVNRFLWREVLDAVTKNVGLFKLVLPGRKKNRNIKNYYTVLNTRSDWAEAYRDYLKSSPHNIEGCLFRNDHGQPLKGNNIQYYFHLRAVEAGVIEQFSPRCSRCQSSTVRAFRKYKDSTQKIAYICKQCGNIDWACELNENFRNIRYGANPHEIRDLMRSRWQVSGADPLVCEFAMGHDVDVNHYNKFMKYEPWYPLREYQKALPWLNILSQDPTKVDRQTVDTELEGHKQEIQLLKKELSTRRIDPDKLRFIEEFGELVKDPEVAESFKQWLKDLPKNKS